MTLYDYCKSYLLVNDVYDTRIDLNYFKSRFLYRYARRQIRGDVPVEEIVDIAQNVIDINREFLKNLFASDLNPFQTNTETTEKTENTLATFDGGGGVTDSGNSSVKNTGGVTASHYVNAFNSASDDNLHSKDVNDDHTSSTQTTSNTQTRDIHDTSTNDVKTNEQKTSFNFDTYKQVFTARVNAYDFLVNLIAPEILEIIER